MIPQKGYIYYLKGFPTVKVFNGNEFICLYSDQVISRYWDITQATGLHISQWQCNIYKKERFAELIADSPQTKRIRAAVDEALKQLDPLLTDQYKRPGK